MFSGRHISEGKTFIDRDVEPFLSLISFLRNNQKIASFNDKQKEEQFNLELNYWGFRNDFGEEK